MMKLCQRVPDEKEIPEDWQISVMMPIYKGKGDVMDCRAYRGVMLLKNGIKIVKRVLEKRIKALVLLDNGQFGFVPGRGMTDALFIV